MTVTSRELPAPPLLPRASVLLDPARLVPWALASVYLIWGSTYLAIKWMVETIPPLLGGAVRFTVAGLVLYGVMRLRGAERPSARAWLASVPAGLGLFLVGNGFVAIAASEVPSSFTAVVCAMIPLLMALLGSFAGDRPSLREGAGLLLGFAGVAVVTTRELSGAPIAASIIVLAPLGWVLGSLAAKRLPQAPGLMGASTQMIAGGAGLLGVALLRGESAPAAVSARSVMAFVYLTLVGSVVAFSAYSFLLRNTRPSVATSYAYVNPVIAVFLGVAIGGEALSAQTLAGSALVVTGIVVVVRARAK